MNVKNSNICEMMAALMLVGICIEPLHSNGELASMIGLVMSVLASLICRAIEDKK